PREAGVSRRGPEASVIVRTLDSARSLERCLQSLRRQTISPEIVVVDSGSADATLPIAERLADTVLTLDRRAFSYGRALNLGAEAARAPVHFALSSHCFADRRDWIERSLWHYGRVDVAATNGQQTCPDGSPLREVLHLTAATALPDPFWGFSNHASSWRADVWRREPFHESLPASEDFEWADRVLALGLTIAFDPALAVAGDHRTHQGPLALYRRSRRELLGIAACRAVAPPTLSGSVASWWSDHPPHTKRHRQWLSPYRIAVIGGRYAAGRPLARERRRRPPGSDERRPSGSDDLRAHEIDILYVASGTTPGLRRADDEVLRALRELEVRVLPVTGDYSLPWRVRRYVFKSMLTIDLFEAMAIRRATKRALGVARPRAVIYATTHAAMLAPRRGAPAPAAIRFDTLAAASRRGRRYAVEHWLERRQFKRASVLVPSAVEVDPTVACHLPRGTPVVPVPIPVAVDGSGGLDGLEGSDGVDRSRGRRATEPITVVYAGNPAKKGLDVALAAWALLGDLRERRLVVTGIDRAAASWYLERRAVREPAGIEWRGMLSAEEHRALTRRAEVYLCASRYEDYGVAQLEALADGALLVTVPAPGPYVALPIARELHRRLVADGSSAEDLAIALKAAFELPESERRAYRARARERLRAFSHASLRERLRDQVLPALLT
ncbi:MAG: glycosyltransferase, partial [Solirubrobacteraceae bacterium]